MNKEYKEFEWIERIEITKLYISTMYLIPVTLYIILCLVKFLEFKIEILFNSLFCSTIIIAMTFILIRKGYGIQYYKIKMLEKHLSIEVSNKSNYRESNLKNVKSIYQSLFVQNINCKMEVKYEDLDVITEDKKKNSIILKTVNERVSSIKVKAIDSELKIKILKELGKKIAIDNKKQNRHITPNLRH